MSDSEQSPTAASVLDAAIDRALAAVDVQADIRVGDPGRRQRLAAAGRPVHDLDADDPTAAAVCVDGEMPAAGEHAESLLDRLVRGVVPGGTLLLTFTGAFAAAGTEDARGGTRRTWRPEDVRTFLGMRGVRLEALVGPGAAALAAGGPPAYDPVLDTEPSLLGIAPALLAVARAPASWHERSDVFFSAIPRKTVAAATITRRSDGAVLVVYDEFKRHWTIPGGLVDHDEDPRTAAARETREESGVDVETGALGAVFHALRPDRLIFVYTARPLDDGAQPAPIHDHEIGAAEWVPLDEALRRVPPYTAEHISGSLSPPVRVHLQR